MLAVFLGALFVGGGVLVVQLFAGHDTHDASVDHGSDAGHDAGVSLSALATLRFWSFALFAFGLVGTLVTIFGFAGALTASLVAAAFGIACGFVAVAVTRSLTRRGPSSHSAIDDAVGCVGRVIVPPNEEGRAKVRVQIKGASVDYLARVAEPSEALEEGESVLVESTEGAELRVSRAPRELT